MVAGLILLPLARIIHSKTLTSINLQIWWSMAQ
jgi:hypothetical protein